jgi:alkylation response protein AidB-like acyl-CoA dehydrogenase
MDFKLPLEAEAFRQELRKFIEREWPEEMRQRVSRRSDESYQDERAFRRKLGQKGWLALSWPKRYGGQERSPLEYYAFQEEMAYHGAPAFAGHAIGVTIVAPVLLRFGSEAQRQRFLPRIAAGEIDFCLGYSEPEAGSDLASLQLRAEDHGDTFVLNGVKRWTSGAHHFDYCWLAARTDPSAPKHQGISLFMVDMKTPGIIVRPIWTMAGYRTNETYWENVVVPRENMVGEKNRGWYYVAAALDFERLTVFPVGRFRAEFERLVTAVRKAEYDGRRLKDDPFVRQKIAQISMELEAVQMLSYRTAWLVSRGEIPSYEASMLKMYGSEAEQRMSHLATQIFGLYGQLRAGAPDAVLDGEIEWGYREMVMPTFGAGANEIQRNIIATRGLGLPRG